MILTVEINNSSYKTEAGKSGVSVNDSSGFDLQQIGSKRAHIINNNKSYLTELISFNPAEKSGLVKVNSNIYHFKVKDQYDELLQKLGIDNLAVARISELKAPMPGMVLNILVKEGQEVKKGENLLILEAMKMENIIKSPADLKIGSIKIQQGNKVEKNQTIITFL